MKFREPSETAQKIFSICLATKFGIGYIFCRGKNKIAMKEQDLFATDFKTVKQAWFAINTKKNKPGFIAAECCG